MARTRTIWVACLLRMLHLAGAQTIGPANNTDVASNNDDTAVEIYHGGSSTVMQWSVSPVKNGTSMPDDGLRGPIVSVTGDTIENYLTVNNKDLVVMSCDTYSVSSNLQPSGVLQEVLPRNPVAILLYSTSSGVCALTGTESSYENIYTMKSRMDSGDVSKAAAQDGAQAWIAKSAVLNSPSNQISGSSSGNNTNNNDQNSWGPSPSTAVAMIILYSITGIITALFLVIIITGAVRAHRHPERYGPRNIIGRPRQSRARGLARAMLETLPIVRFGESHEEGRNKPTDVELAEGTHGTVEMLPDQDAAQHTSNEQPREATQQSDSQGLPATTEGGIAPATERKSSVPQENQGCSICTEDFEVGQDQRVLPCDHRYHPACIDPWLLNVSGTCPLCRIDLRPQASGDEELDESGNPIPRESDAMAPPLNGEQQRSSIRRSLLLGITGIGRPERLTREERVAAIRRYAQQQRAAAAEDAAAAGDASALDPTEESSMRRRLRNAFRVRTRRTGEDGQVQEVPEAPVAAEASASASTEPRRSVDGSAPHARS